MSKLGEAYFFHSSPIYLTETSKMENVDSIEVHSCDSVLCPYVRITGKHIAVTFIGAAVLCFVVYLLVRYRVI